MRENDVVERVVAFGTPRGAYACKAKSKHHFSQIEGNGVRVGRREIGWDGRREGTLNAKTMEEHCRETERNGGPRGGLAVLVQHLQAVCRRSTRTEYNARDERDVVSM